MDEGESMDSEKAALREFADLIDKKAVAAFAGNDMQVFHMSNVLRQVRELVNGRDDVSFAFAHMIDGRDYPKLVSDGEISILYRVEGAADVVSAVDDLMTDAMVLCAMARDQVGVLDPEKRAAEKQASRDEDARMVAAREITEEELRRKSSFFGALFEGEHRGRWKIVAIGVRSIKPR